MRSWRHSFENRLCRRLGKNKCFEALRQFSKLLMSSMHCKAVNDLHHAFRLIYFILPVPYRARQRPFYVNATSKDNASKGQVRAGRFSLPFDVKFFDREQVDMSGEPGVVRSNRANSVFR